MTIDNNDMRANHNLPATPEPKSPSRFRQPGPESQAPRSATPDQPDLAERDRRLHSEWQRQRDLTQAEYVMQARVKHPDGGERTVAETQADETEQRQLIKQDTDKGSRKHHRLPQWQRWIPKIVLFFDFILLLYFFAGITNVNWQAPLSVNMAFAVILAAMVTVLAFGFLAFTGHRMRSYKTHAGTVHLHDLDGFTKVAFGTALAVIIVLAVLMYLRIRSEVIEALGLGNGTTALAIPLAVAVVSAVANFLVVLIHTFDGSEEVYRLNKLAAASHRLARRAHRLRKRAAARAYR
jgi:hypothetical protein